MGGVLWLIYHMPERKLFNPVPKGGFMFRKIVVFVTMSLFLGLSIVADVSAKQILKIGFPIRGERFVSNEILLRQRHPVTL